MVQAVSDLSHDEVLTLALALMILLPVVEQL
jgi:hypothetical protein